jgi:ribosomal protein S18 acetylase RimI-like enzyme
VVTRTARPDDLPAVLSLVRQHRAAAHADGVISGQTPGTAAAAGFRRLLSDPGHRVVLAVLPGAAAPDGSGGGEVPVAMMILGIDPLSVVLGVPQVSIDNLVVHPAHRRRGAGAALLLEAVAYAEERGAAHVVANCAGQDPERQRFFARLGFAPLTIRRIVPRETLARSLAAWRRSGLVPVPRRMAPRRRPWPLPAPGSGTRTGTIAESPARPA